MSRRRLYTDEQFTKAVADNTNMSATLRELGLKVTGGSAVSAKSRISNMGLSTTHWVSKTASKGSYRVPLSELLTPNCPYDRTTVKRRLIQEGVLRNICALCGTLPEWRGEPLVLQLDHINGVSDDNQIENLRILCPNCHTQTSTFTGRNKPKKSERNCTGCGALTNRATVKCISCAEDGRFEIPRRADLVHLVWTEPLKRVAEILGVSNRVLSEIIRSENVDLPKKGHWNKSKFHCAWPSKEVLTKLVWEMPATTLANQLGVSAPAIKKHCKALGVCTPPKGYWTKIKVDRGGTAPRTTCI